MKFRLDARLENDSVAVCQLDLCQLRILDDCRWPWLILVPQRHGAVEIHDLDERDQLLLAAETAGTAKALKQITQCTKINIGALGNIVRQLHVHVIARSEADPNWPGPVWGFETRIAYGGDELDRFRQRVLDVMERPQSRQ